MCSTEEGWEKYTLVWLLWCKTIKTNDVHTVYYSGVVWRILLVCFIQFYTVCDIKVSAPSLYPPVGLWPKKLEKKLQGFSCLGCFFPQCFDPIRPAIPLTSALLLRLVSVASKWCGPFPCLSSPVRQKILLTDFSSPTHTYTLQTSLSHAHTLHSLSLLIICSLSHFNHSLLLSLSVFPLTV